MERFEEVCQTWEILGAVHGADLKIPYLEEKRRELRRKEKRDKPPVPLHLKFAMAGFNVKTKKT